VATIRELLDGNIADVRLSAREASTAISIIQTFSNAADGIAATLNKMEELAKKASSPDYSRVQIEAMQKEFKSLAEEINEIVQGTKYNYNKIFTSAGESISIPIGDGSKVDIFARDFSFNSQGLDLTADPKSALSNIKKAITNLNEYKQYLNRQVARVEDATATIESELESAMGIELGDFTPEIAIETAVYTASQLSQDSSTALDTQANVTADEALQLLKYRS
jgi:flagellin-like hook-associated protein FlgL